MHSRRTPHALFPLSRLSRLPLSLSPFVVPRRRKEVEKKKKREKEREKRKEGKKE